MDDRRRITPGKYTCSTLTSQHKIMMLHIGFRSILRNIRSLYKFIPHSLSTHPFITPPICTTSIQITFQPLIYAQIIPIHHHVRTKEIKYLMQEERGVNLANLLGRLRWALYHSLSDVAFG